MALTVGLTAAAGVHLILTKQLPVCGVLTPTIPEVYIPALQLLAQEGIRLEEDVIQVKPPQDDPLALTTVRARPRASTAPAHHALGASP